MGIYVHGLAWVGPAVAREGHVWDVPVPVLSQIMHCFINCFISSLISPFVILWIIFLVTGNSKGTAEVNGKDDAFCP